MLGEKSGAGEGN